MDCGFSQEILASVFLAFLLSLAANFSPAGGINDEFFHPNSLVVKLLNGISELLLKKKNEPFP